MDLSLIYRALANKQVDFIAGDATSGLIDAYGLVMLEDDRHYFPPYDAVPVARAAVLLAHPELREALGSLRISVAEMRRMNLAVDAEHRDAADVAREFPAVRSPLSALRCPLSAVRSPLSALRCPLSALRCPLSARCPAVPLSRCPTVPLSAVALSAEGKLHRRGEIDGSPAAESGQRCATRCRLARAAFNGG
jgi:hypothetical protein